ncbi:MAG: hypothetical protein HOD92_00200 [Deltaproteobacteria bacterium]|jgi:hypothetical protein|nr:hypothetical protein [Deltaproteobacteria bacterium]MBT4526478.1 hypothetical protein [Deltaproteobacteria bacterium]
MAKIFKLLVFILFFIVGKGLEAETVQNPKLILKNYNIQIIQFEDNYDQTQTIDPNKYFKYFDDCFKVRRRILISEIMPGKRCLLNIKPLFGDDVRLSLSLKWPKSVESRWPNLKRLDQLDAHELAHNWGYLYDKEWLEEGAAYLPLALFNEQEKKVLLRIDYKLKDNARKNFRNWIKGIYIDDNKLLLSGWVFKGNGKFKPEDISKDKDSDGLNDLEEKLYGTDINQKDSDKDGFSDMFEIQSGYNPLDVNHPGEPTIMIDGNITDWNHIEKEFLDKKGDSKDDPIADFKSFKAYYDGINRKIYLKMDFYNKIEFSKGTKGWFQVKIDLKGFIEAGFPLDVFETTAGNKISLYVSGGIGKGKDRLDFYPVTLKKKISSPGQLLKVYGFQKSLIKNHLLILNFAS